MPPIQISQRWRRKRRPQEDGGADDDGQRTPHNAARVNSTSESPARSLALRGGCGCVTGWEGLEFGKSWEWASLRLHDQAGRGAEARIAGGEGEQVGVNTLSSTSVSLGDTTEATWMAS